jgi:hypothetical protein
LRNLLITSKCDDYSGMAEVKFEFTMNKNIYESSIVTQSATMISRMRTSSGICLVSFCAIFWLSMFSISSCASKMASMAVSRLSAIESICWL